MAMSAVLVHDCGIPSPQRNASGVSMAQTLKDVIDASDCAILYLIASWGRAPTALPIRDWTGTVRLICDHLMDARCGHRKAGRDVPACNVANARRETWATTGRNFLISAR